MEISDFLDCSSDTGGVVRSSQAAGIILTWRGEAGRELGANIVGAEVVPEVSSGPVSNPAFKALEEIK